MTMSIKNQTADFLHLLCCYIKANPDCLVAVADYDKAAPGKLLLGYYDDAFYYIRPEVFLPVVRAEAYGNYQVDMRHILRELFALNFIKVHWILCGEVRYRPQKRIGTTRKRYITMYRRQLETYMDEHFSKEADNEQS